MTCPHPDADVHKLKQSSLFGDETIRYCARCHEILETWVDEGSSLKEKDTSHSEQIRPYPSSQD